MRCEGLGALGSEEKRMPHSQGIRLDKQLERLSPELSRRLNGVIKAVNEIWRIPRLHWYTDHGVAHSARIIGLLGQILSPLYSDRFAYHDEYPCLSAYELYVLLAACYLHDIGMQYLKVESLSVDELTPRDYEKIRKLHPVRSFELIRDRTIKPRGRRNIDLGLSESDQDDSLMPIALVAKAHGSDYFDEVVADLERNPYCPAGQPIRGALLAALLMMGDELDMHKSRANLPDDTEKFPSLSLLHHYKHTYVSSVGVQNGRSSTDRQISIRFLFPPGAEGCYADEIVQWITEEVKQPLQRTQEILIRSTDGKLRWDEREPLVTKVDYDKYGEREQLPPKIQAILKELLGGKSDEGSPNTGEQARVPRVSPAGRRAYLRLRDRFGEGERVIPLEMPVTWIGRSPTCDLRVGKMYFNVSGIHAHIKRLEDKFVLFDGDGTKPSRRGTFVGNQAVNSASGKVLEEGDRIILGEIEKGEPSSGACVLLFSFAVDKHSGFAE